MQYVTHEGSSSEASRLDHRVQVHGADGVGEAIEEVHKVLANITLALASEDARQCRVACFTGLMSARLETVLLYAIH